MTRIFILQQKLSNIPEQSLIRRNRKSIQAYNYKFHVIVMSQTSSLNIAIKNGKQLIIPVANRRR